MQMEKSSRMLFLWKAEVEDQKEKASDIVRRNEALVYNILPKHVAAHFLGNRKRQYDELYSQSYSEVGVLFASMPNFAGKNYYFTRFNSSSITLVSFYIYVKINFQFNHLQSKFPSPKIFS